MSLSELLQIAGGSRPLLDLVSDSTVLPFEALDVPTTWYNSPPAFVPIWSNGSSGASYGLWTHDVAGTYTCYVVYDMEAAHAKEISRTNDQFLTYIVIKALTESDSITDEVRKLARLLDIHNLDEIDEHTRQHGDDERCLSKLGVFATDTPACAVTEGLIYNGAFPLSGKEPSVSELDQYLYAELGNERIFQIPQVRLPKRFLRSTNKQGLFYREVDEGKFDEAWRTLNSPGWSVGDAALALSVLARRRPEVKLLAALHDAWQHIAGDSY